MPLRDHFRPPLSRQSSWEEVHGGWPMVIVQRELSIDVRCFLLLATARPETMAGIMEPSAYNRQPAAYRAALAERRPGNSARS